jgi:hypothetical protein
VPDCGVREEARHSRAGLLIMPSLRDSSRSAWSFPALPCRAIDMPSLRDSSVSDFRPPALPCRAIDYAVPTGLLHLRRVPSRYSCAGL